ncbi:MAG: histidine ammonia-lyase [Clostridia bacterium]|nr:histidine ammonia-lyase [Clostridia bacterium]
MIDGTSLGLADVWRVAQGGEPPDLAPEARARLARSRRSVEEALASGRAVYGVNTGFGRLAEVRVGEGDLEALQLNLLRSHAAGVGEPFPSEVVRAMMLLRANALAVGASGVRPELVEFLIAMLRAGVHPRVPSQGSLGASGDLAPLAHLALVVVGEGEADYRGRVLPGDLALREAGLAPLRLAPKEGLALINGTQAMTAQGALALVRAKALAAVADLALALSLQALAGLADPFRPEVQALRPHPGQARSAGRILRLLEGSRLLSQPGGARVQDAYSLRAAACVHGASLDAIAFAERVVVTEMNSATDNPLLLEDGVVSAANFHGQPVALALDLLGLAVHELGDISERRTFRLLDPNLSGLPPFLAERSGLFSGLMIPQYVAASLVAENRLLASPASADSIPSSADQEDHVSMGALAARKADRIVRNVARILAIELITACQAVEFRGREGLSPLCLEAYRAVRRISPPVREDRSLSGEIERLAEEILALRFPPAGVIEDAPGA